MTDPSTEQPWDYTINRIGFSNLIICIDSIVETIAFAHLLFLYDYSWRLEHLSVEMDRRRRAAAIFAIATVAFIEEKNIKNKNVHREGSGEKNSWSSMMKEAGSFRHKA